MLLLEEVKQKTDSVFGQDELVVPEPSHHWRRKLEALEEARLPKQRAAAIFDMRCEQAKMLGFEQIEMEQMVEMLMGEPHTDHNERTDLQRQNHEWFYNHHTGVILEGNACNWGGHPHDYFRLERKSRWYLPPFSKHETWRCRFGKLDYLKRDIPYGVVLRIQEVKKLNLFNVFNVLAPQDAWERKTDIDPIVTATIWEIPPVDKGNATAGQAAHFFLAQW